MDQVWANISSDYANLFNKWCDKVHYFYYGWLREFGVQMIIPFLGKINRFRLLYMQRFNREIMKYSINISQINYR